jgi:hypothetical protein
MPSDYFKPRGATKSSQDDAGGATVRTTPIFGVVKNNIDANRSGALQVYISDMSGTNPQDSGSWVTVNYMSPFFGFTSGSPPNTGWGGYVENSASYGMWTSPPDIGTTVICIFINGDMNYGYWIGCVPKPEKLYMVPAIGGAEDIVANPGETGYGGATRLPVTNINTNNNKINDATKFFDEPKPVHSYAATVLSQQGLLRDPVRGVIGSTAQRETPSRVGFGISTPGRPIYAGGYTDETLGSADSAAKTQIISRRAGHSIVMDDGDISGRDQLIRLRTSLGHQILMSDDGQTLFIIHANGQSYIELGKEGTIDMYSTNSVNIRTQGDLNLHADNNININAVKDLTMKAKNIKLESEESTTHRVGTDYSMQVLGQYTVKVNGQLSFAAGADASFASGGAAYIKGSKVNLNTGQTSATPKEVKPIPIIAHTDTLNDATKGWLAAPGKLQSIVSRAPAHAPWANANQGVDVKIDNSAAASLPTAPSATVASTNAAVPAQPTNPTSPALSSTAPPVPPVSKAIDKGTATAMVSQVAASAANGPAKDAVAAGQGVVDTPQGKVAAVGPFAQNPTQFEFGKILKPGAAALVNSLIQSGKTLEQAMTPNLFTGKVGADSLGAYANNLTAQISTQVEGFKIAQSNLINSGLLTGKEAGTQMAGVVMSAATVGIPQTIGFVQNAANQTLAGAQASLAAAAAPINNVLGSVADNLSAGKFAAALSNGVTGGLSSLGASLAGMAGGVTKSLDSLKGAVAGAFDAIASALPKLEAGVPQNLRKIAEGAIADANNEGADAAATVANQQAGSPNASGVATGTDSSAFNPLAQFQNAGNTIYNNIKSQLSPAITTIQGIGPNLSKFANNITSINTTDSASAGGISSLPGGQQVTAVVTNFKDSLVNTVNALPGTKTISALIDSKLSGVTNELSKVDSVFQGINNAATQVTTAAKNVGSALENLTTGKGLTSLSQVGIPASILAKADALISAFSSGGASSVKMPTVATNTDGTRSALDAQTTAQLGNPAIPPPNYGRQLTGSESKEINNNLAKLASQSPESNASSSVPANKPVPRVTTAEVDQLAIERHAAQKAGMQARLAYENAAMNLPQGDPKIASLKLLYEAAFQREQALNDKYQVARATLEKQYDSGILG